MDEFHIDFIDILKIDIEGAERFVFDKASPEWIKNVRCIAIELHDSECRERFLSAVSSYDAKLSRHGEVNLWERSSQQ